MRTYHGCLLTLAVLFAGTIFSGVPVSSQVLDGVPHLINYQGRLTDSGGDPVTNGEYVVTFSIWSDSISTSSPDREWISPNCTLLVVNGLFNWQLGSKENLPPWTVTNDAALWLGIQVESDPEITPRTRFCSAPYAYKAWQADYAEYADSAGVVLSGVGGWVDDGNVIRLDTASDSVGIGTSTPSEKLDVVGTTQMTGFKMPTGATDGHVLTSDADGNGTWLAPASTMKALTGATNGTTHGVSGEITVWFNVDHTDEFSSPPVIFAEACDPSSGLTKHGDVTASTLAYFVVQIKESVGGALVVDQGIDVRYMAIGQ
jgi:hypothetical protein